MCFVPLKLSIEVQLKHIGLFIVIVYVKITYFNYQYRCFNIKKIKCSVNQFNNILNLPANWLLIIFIAAGMIYYVTLIFKNKKA